VNAGKLFNPFLAGRWAATQKPLFPKSPFFSKGPETRGRMKIWTDVRGTIDLGAAPSTKT